jgi:hypothetical protein
MPDKDIESKNEESNNNHCDEKKEVNKWLNRAYTPLESVH